MVVLPISEKFNDYARKVADYLNRYDVRAQVDDRNEKIGRKIRDNELKRIPYLVIVGEKEEAEGKVSIRVQGEGDKGQMTLEEYKDYMVGLVKAEMEANKIEKINRFAEPRQSRVCANSAEAGKRPLKPNFY